MHRSLVLAATFVTALLIAACGADASGSAGTTPSSTAAMSDPLTQSDFCKAGGDLATALTALSNSTDTTGETVGKLNTVQSELQTAIADAQTLQPGDTKFATEATNLATAVGHLKVALDNNDTTAGNAAVSEVGTAVSASPACH